MFSALSSARLAIAATLFFSVFSSAQVTKPSADSPAMAGRVSLTHYLDSLAVGYTERRHAEVAAIRTREEAEARQAKVRARMLDLIGELPQKTPLQSKILGTVQGDGFHIEKILFESQPGFPVTALLYLPDRTDGTKRLPAILMAPGHSPAGKSGDYAMAVTFVKNGFAVLSYDPIGQGERLQYPDPKKQGISLAARPTGEHGEAGLQPTLIGDALARYFLWDAMRGVDYLSERSEVDAKKIGAFGCSGGGAMTALVGALDTRLAAVGSACYITSFDALLPAIGPQDGEQSSPSFIASSLDFPDWIELAAPRPYAVISTYSDMFPFEGARRTVAEARHFYSLFDPASAGTSTGQASGSMPPIPTEPARNADTTNAIPVTAALQFITGPGRHGALKPITEEIVRFFVVHLKQETNTSIQIPSETGFASLPKDALQVTPTGQLLTSYPEAETVYSLNRKRAEKLLPQRRPALSASALADVVRKSAGVQARPGESPKDAALLSEKSGPVVFHRKDSADPQGELAVPSSPGKHPAVLFLVPASLQGNDSIARANKIRFDALVAKGNLVLALTPRPSPPGTDDMKAPILGPFYLLSLRAELVGRTIEGIRTDDVIRALDYLSARSDVDTKKISAVGSGHMGLVLMYAALFDSRLMHIAVDHVLSSYRSLLEAPLPTGAAEDIVPGALLHYDIPDIARILGARLEQENPLQGTDDLSQCSTPLKALAGSSAQ